MVRMTFTPAAVPRALRPGGWTSRFFQTFSFAVLIPPALSKLTKVEAMWVSPDHLAIEIRVRPRAPVTALRVAEDDEV
jgi:hypothetical protein